MQHVPPPSDGRYPASARQDPVYSSPAYGPPATAYAQYTQSIPASSEARPEGAPPAPFMTQTSDSPVAAAGRRTRKRKTPPTSNPPSVAAPGAPQAQGQYEFESNAAQGAVDHSQQQQSTSQFALDPGMQTFVGQDVHGPNDDDEGSQTRSPGNSRPVNPSKRAEQNRKAQRAFRERRDAHVKTLEHRSSLLDQYMADLQESNRRFEECRHMVDTLRMENQRLTEDNGRLADENARLNAALTQYTSTSGNGTSQADGNKETDELESSANDERGGDEDMDDSQPKSAKQ